MARHASSFHPIMRPRRCRSCTGSGIRSVNGVVVTVAGRPFAVIGFTVADGKILEIDALADPERVRRIAAAVLMDE